MERKMIVAGNWKMNMLYNEGVVLASSIVYALKMGFSTRTGVMPEVILAPPYYLLKTLADISGSIPGLVIAAQNCASEVQGAFTGEVSAPMIASAGAGAVIVGHSERRSLFLESDAVLHQKGRQVLDAGLDLIFCVGEKLEEREAGNHFEVVREQLNQGVAPLLKPFAGNIILAYEPVWAIGTGLNATPEQAQEMHLFIRECMESWAGKDIAATTPVLYGGSCKPSNATALFAMPDVDGGLIGGASLSDKDFVDIIKSA